MTGETTEPDDPKCGGLDIQPEVQMEVIPGNVLFIFDKSGSMNEPWVGGTNTKWVDASKAVVDAITPLQDNVNVGAIFFPHPPPRPGRESNDEQVARECITPAFDEAPNIAFMPGPEFLAAWDAFWSPIENEDVTGRTPLYEGMQSAKALLEASDLKGTTRVVIITDGAPNCMTSQQGDVNGRIAFLSTTPAEWLAAGIQTHVLGLPGADQPDAVTILNGVAAAGGTDQHISAADPAALQTELGTIIGQSVSSGFTSCTIDLPKKPPNPEDVHVLVTEGGQDKDVGRDLGTGGGWELAGDLTEITLGGPLCDLALMGQYERIQVVFGCVDVPPLDPPAPPE